MPRLLRDQPSGARKGRSRPAPEMRSLQATVARRSRARDGDHATFAADVELSPLPVLVDAWAPWCGPCRTIAPVIEDLASELAGRVRVAKLNVDENPMTAARFGLRSIPTLLVLAGGREVDRLVGVQPKSEIVRRLE